MSQYFARKKALNQKRDQMIDLFVDSKIKLANKGTTYGEFYDYVTDLDRPIPQAKRPTQPVAQPKPTTSSVSSKPIQPEAQNPAAIAPNTARENAVDRKPSAVKETQKKGNSNFWENYTE